jgi:DNA-directed RNA polymerase
LKDLKLVPDEWLWKASVYVTKYTFASLGEMFVGAKHIMDWLGACAKHISKSGHVVQWVTPLGLPVVQPYKKEKSGRHKEYIKTMMHTITLLKASICTRFLIDTNCLQ